MVEERMTCARRNISVREGRKSSLWSGVKVERSRMEIKVEPGLKINM